MMPQDVLLSVSGDIVYFFQFSDYATTEEQHDVRSSSHLSKVHL
jgi:hypothetical protein